MSVALPRTIRRYSARAIDAKPRIGTSIAAANAETVTRTARRNDAGRRRTASPLTRMPHTSIRRFATHERLQLRQGEGGLPLQVPVQVDSVEDASNPGEFVIEPSHHPSGGIERSFRRFKRVGDSQARAAHHRHLHRGGLDDESPWANRLDGGPMQLANNAEHLHALRDLVA